MKTIAVMEVRKSLGRILDEVQIKSETFVLERAGKPIAKIVPLDSDNPVSSKHNLQKKALHDLRNLRVKTERSEDPAAWLAAERGEWG